MSRCTPCEKEILNGDAPASAAKSHRIAELVKARFEEQRMSKADYLQTITELADADRLYRDTINAIGEQVPDRIAPPWPESGGV